ncbi:MAG TPA: type 4a pilus biogenesis protein PilO [Vicinamibacterales bacterium]
MDISLSKLPWYGQIGAFVLVCGMSIYGFWNFYVVDTEADLALKQTHLTALNTDVTKGIATAQRLGEFQGEVTNLEHRLDSLKNVLPEQKDVADILRRLQGLATQSNLTLLRFTPAGQRQQPLYLEVPYHITAEGSFHNLALFFDRVSKFPRIINVGDIAITAKQGQQPNSTIYADCIATTFVLQEAAGRGGRGAPPVRR